MRIAVVTCSPQNDYPRARSLRAAVQACPDVNALLIRNRHTSLLRYPEVVLKLCKTRVFDRPDAYLVTFRGYEILLFMKLTFVRKPIIFDELINFTEWMEEQGRLRAGTLPYRLFRRWYAWLVGKSTMILADTDAHARYSAILNKLSIERYQVLPASIDETNFRSLNNTPKNDKFTVLYYGHMVRLHGLEYVLQAAELLKDHPEITFRIVGGKWKGQVAKACGLAANKGAHITHENWLPFEALPQAIQMAGVTLGGPFGDTLQSRFVVTAKTYQVMACAAPVVVGKNEVNEGFADRVNCLVVPQADAKKLAETILWASQHPQELAKIGREGHKLYEEQFSQKHSNQVMRQIVEKL